MWKMILADGTELTGFGRNGNNYSREEKVDEAVFAGNLSTLTLTDGEEEIVLHNAELVQQAHYTGWSKGVGCTLAPSFFSPCGQDGGGRLWLREERFLTERWWYVQ